MNSDRKNPVTSGTNMWWGVIYSHAGGYSLIKNEMFGIFLNDLYYNLVKDDYEIYQCIDMEQECNAALNRLIKEKRNYSIK